MDHKRESLPEPDKVIAWYCSHDDEPRGSGSHLERVWKKKRQEWAVRGSTGAMRIITFEKPVCPRAVPLVTREADIALARPVYPAPVEVS